MREVGTVGILRVPELKIQKGAPRRPIIGSATMIKVGQSRNIANRRRTRGRAKKAG